MTERGARSLNRAALQGSKKHRLLSLITAKCYRASVKRLLQSPQARALFAWAAAAYVVFAARTTRWHIENLPPASAQPLIVVFWHEALPAMPIFWLRWKPSRPAIVLASQHRDGQLIGRAVQHLGIGLVSGSSSRGGATALRALLTALKTGAHIGITPDGPRGPRRACAPGALQLAALSGAPILPCGAVIARAKTLASWDAMRIPLPFSHGALVCGPPLTIAREGWETAIPALTAALNATMDRAASLL
jgi:lysophospholipid acyltransferase (LPLAT)-like uncharacterized protein